MTPPRKAAEPTFTPPIPAVKEEPAAHVIEALRRVMRDLPAIGKDGRASAEQGGYAYRGIEAITQHVQQLCARHGIVFVPRVANWERDEVLVGRENRVWHDDRLTVLYDVYGPGGVTDSITVGPIPAIGRDGADKGANKAMTQAFKYALIQTFCISDKADDNDGHTQEAERAPAMPLVSVETRDAIQAAITGATDPKVLKKEWAEHALPALSRLTVDRLDNALAFLAARGITIAGDAPAPDIAAAAQQVAAELGGGIACPNCGEPVNDENPVRTWPDPEDTSDTPRMVAGCAGCEPF